MSSSDEDEGGRWSSKDDNEWRASSARDKSDVAKRLWEHCIRKTYDTVCLYDHLRLHQKNSLVALYRPTLC